MASRLRYGMANERILPAVFARVHPRRRTPYVAIVFTTALCAVLITVGTLTELAQATVMLLLCVFTLANVAVLILRRDRVEHPHFVAPTVLPIAGAVVSVTMLAKLIEQQDSWLSFLIVAVLLVAGAALWVLDRRLVGQVETAT